MQTYTRSSPNHLHNCINALISHGADFEDGPVMDIYRGDLDDLEAPLEADAGLAKARFSLDYGNHLTLRGSTLLHVAVEFHVRDAIALLLDHGADLNARAAIGKNGVGGQTLLYHAIGTNQGTGFHVFVHLLELKPELAVEAKIQSNSGDNNLVMDCIHKGKDHFFEEVLRLTPRGYAERLHANRSGDRRAARQPSCGDWARRNRVSRYLRPQNPRSWMLGAVVPQMGSHVSYIGKLVAHGIPGLATDVRSLQQLSEPSGGLRRGSQPCQHPVRCFRASTPDRNQWRFAHTVHTLTWFF